MSDAPRLTVVIPTHDRPLVLRETLERLVAYAATAPIEVLVIHDGRCPETTDIAQSATTNAGWPLRVLIQEGFGPAPKRNRAIAEAEAPVCLFIGDDALPTKTLISGHLDFHARRPDLGDALLGSTVAAPPLDGFPFVRWLHEEGGQFNYAALTPYEEAGPTCFWTANVSVKRDLMRQAGGFDESFPVVVAEDIEFGFRLAAAGMRLFYEPVPVAQHFHPTDLRRTLVRMRDVGIAFRTLCDRTPEVPRPTRPATRHRAKAAALVLAMLAGRPTAARHATWRFLCDQVIRESYWGSESAGAAPRTGRALTRLALRDPQANPPLPDRPLPAATA